MIEFWTFNARPMLGKPWLPNVIYAVFLALCVAALISYIGYGFENRKPSQVIFMILPILMFGSINIGFIITGIHTKFMDQK